MKSIVVDASVAIKWFIPEIHSMHATRLLHTNLKLIAPDLIFAEVGNILWKKCRLKELTFDTAYEILNDFKKLPFYSHTNESLLDTAWHIATEYECTIYDSLYVALAQIEGCALVTADRALHTALNSAHLDQLSVWIENIKDICK